MEVRTSGYSQVILDAKGDLADIFSLTCLEAGVECLDPNSGLSCPTVEMNGSKFVLHKPNERDI
jgi:hypothetical protein